MQRTEDLDNLYSTTWQKMRKEAVDNIFNATPFWFYISDKGKRRTEEGGRWIGVQLMYGKNTSVKSFGRGDTFTLPDDEILTTAQFEWRYNGGSVVRYWEDDQKNRGQAQIMNLLTAKMDNLKLSLTDKLESDLFAASPGPSDINSLLQLVNPTAPAAVGDDVVGQIDSFTHTWWQNRRKKASGPASTHLLADMRNLYNTCSRGNDTPDFILTDQDSFELYEGELTEMLRIVDKKMSDAGFEALSFKGKPITWAPSCPTGHMFFLNTRYIEWVADEFANFDMTEWKPVQDSLDRAAQVVVAGNLVTSNRRMQGVMYDISA